MSMKLDLNDQKGKYFIKQKCSDMLRKITFWKKASVLILLLSAPLQYTAQAKKGCDYTQNAEITKLLLC